MQNDKQRNNRRRKYYYGIVIALIILLISVGYSAYQSTLAKQTTVPVLTTFTTPPSFTLAIGTVSQLPKGANYSLGAEYPDASRIIRIRVIDATGYSISSMSWDSPLNAQQILFLINQLHPQVLERMTAGIFNWSAPVSVCSTCLSMDYGQFLNASMDVCGCYIVPRLNIVGVSTPTFLSEARYLLTVPIFPRFQMLSIDNWASYCASNSSNCGCAQDQSIFQALYQMGWKGIGVLNAGPPYYGTCGWATFVDFDTTTDSWTVNQSFYDSIKADTTVQKILYYDPDFPGQAQTLLASCNSSCNQVASVVESAAMQQSSYGITYVYPIVQNFWDATAIRVTNGTSLYKIEENLLDTYNPVSLHDMVTA